MDMLFSPFVRFWKWVDKIGGYPGQVFFCIAAIMLIVGFFTWLANKK
jgi:hypothetical protein